ncbi:MAG: glycosyl hydrolase family 8 [Cyanobacteria bacterium P01_A01_bin.105]
MGKLQLLGGLLLVLGGCPQAAPPAVPPAAGPAAAGAPANAPPADPTRPASSGSTATLATSLNLDRSFFEDSWVQYRQRFIQGDGRVIDWETDDQRTTSEGQAYAMLRAVMIDDPDSFERVLRWGENNLARRGPEGQLLDNLWAWKWGPETAAETRSDDAAEREPPAALPETAKSWGITDVNFASDADIDVVTALILAGRRWDRQDYLDLAQDKLADLWAYSTIAAPDASRYLLPGPLASFSPTPETVYLNPSYLAPYAFRLFAQVDRDRNWQSLIDTSYEVLTASADLSTQALPSNWVALNLGTGTYAALPDDAPIQSIYGFDAYRVWWRVALDAAWFDAPEARQYLREHLPPLVNRWQQQQAIPAEIDLTGNTLTDFESTAQYAMLYRGLTEVDITMARALRDQKLIPAYRDGFWDSSSAYYTQNLAWLGLFPPEWVSVDLLTPM